MSAARVHLPTLLRAFVRARWTLRFRGRESLLAWQARQVRRFVRGALRRAPFYRDLAARELAELPVVDKATVLARFHDFNRIGVDLATARAVAERAERERDFTPTLPGGITVGLSSGTSGRPSVFLVDAGERARWAGTILGRMLTAASLRRVLAPFAAPLRVALFLRANSNLYTSVHSRRVRFAFFDLLSPLDSHRAALDALQPHVLVAPSSVLAALAVSQLGGALRIRPEQVLAVAEVLEADDDARIRAAFGCAPGQIYQCTEGLLGQSCAAGTLHLDEEHVHFEPQWLDAERTRFVPVITDFARHTQVFARYRLDDVLRVAPAPCPCGRAGLAIAAVEGRQDDVLWLPSRTDGAPRALFPDVVRRAMALAGERFDDYRIEQHRTRLVVRLQHAAGALHGDGERAVRTELVQLCRAADLVPPTIEFGEFVPPPPGTKRRRVQRVEPGSADGAGREAIA